jgi:hypothetical protein
MGLFTGIPELVIHGLDLADATLLLLAAAGDARWNRRAGATGALV